MPETLTHSGFPGRNNAEDVYCLHPPCGKKIFFAASGADGIWRIEQTQFRTRFTA